MYGGVRQQMHRESSLQLIALTGGTDVSNNADLNIIYNKIVLVSICSAYKMIVKKFWTDSPDELSNQKPN